MRRKRPRTKRVRKAQTGISERKKAIAKNRGATNRIWKRDRIIW
jgi:hypothetical protein